ncbi:hypothetical protein HYS91_03680 [Candidatus Daviesbacteria bacterium]|nr:hypothetical protein [Candidatus Daviesbacteria bacterium]
MAETYKKRTEFRNKSFFNKKTFILISLSILSLFLFVLGYKFLIVKNINISSSNTNCLKQTQIKGEINLMGVNLLLINKNSILNTLQKKYLCIKDIEFKKNFPNNLAIHISGRIPVAILELYPPRQNKIYLNDLEATPSSQAALLNYSFTNINGKDKLLIDEEGYIFAKLANQNLPIIKTDGNLKLGQKAPIEVINATSIIQKIKSENLNLKNIKIVGGKNLIIEMEEKIIFDLKKDYEAQLASLQLILQKSRINFRKMDIVDLRFENPIVTYSPINKK